ncbi:MAG: LEA type 2 family protein [Candidatus Eisenbacteria bacterium]|uniref:LEA type 2 family protein n=1 Tax=Eiseniibacteriota bacterium TaxID=2212470 RepID=A0A956LYL3_UNCEI|nr:LEA type 2 family protein [Candidatus Eisenbacteria bacterium]
MHRSSRRSAAPRFDHREHSTVRPIRVQSRNPRWRSRLVTLLAVGCALWGASGCAAVRKSMVYPRANVDSVKLAGVDLKAATIEFGVAVENPYTVGLPVAGLDFALSTEGKQFLEGQADITQTIPAQGNGMVMVPVRVPFAEIYEVVSGLQLGAKIPYDADLGLRVQTPVLGTVRLPMSAKGEIKLPGL